MKTPLGQLCIAVLLLVTASAPAAHAQSHSYPNMGQGYACRQPAPFAGGLNMGGQTCASGWESFRQRLLQGLGSDKCNPGEQFTGQTNIVCNDVIRPDGRPQANFSARACCSIDAGAANMPPPIAAASSVVAPPPGHHIYTPEAQFNPPHHSHLWRAGYTNNTSCSGPVYALPHFNSGAKWAPMIGFSFGPGNGNADLPVVFKNPMPTPAALNLVFAPHAIALHGSASQCAVLSFVAPHSGTYHVHGNFHQTGHNAGVSPHPLRASVFVGTGGAHHFSGFVSTTSGPHVAPFNLTLPLAAGQQVDFMSNVGGVLNSNTVVLKVTVNGP